MKIYQTQSNNPQTKLYLLCIYVFMSPFKETQILHSLYFCQKHYFLKYLKILFHFFVFYFSVFRDPPVAALVHINCCTLLDKKKFSSKPLTVITQAYHTAISA